ncbi:MAG: mandelate racemase/muconate lactonizing enzyme family protein [Gaiella sp.]|uniref:mandelate racemase/muconate lactonizing enzyme family protein n=1 Tax=Gaiella sp. TaxID=2663207 RepID=UPI003C716BB0
MQITSVTTTAVRTSMREPLTWPGGVRQSASGLVVEVLTDEGIRGIGEAPGPTLPTIRTVIEQELTQFLVGQDPLRTEWLVHRMEEFSRNWNRIAAYAISGLEIALLDLKGKALGAPVVELLGGVCSDRVPVVGYLFIDEPEANARKAKAFVDAGYTELKLKVGRDFGQDHDAIAAIRDAVGPDVKLRIDANMIWSVPAAIKWIRGLEQFDLQYVEQPVPDFDVAGLAQVRRSVAVPIAADEACTDVRSALELVKQDACDVFVIYPSEAGGLTRARQIAAIAEAAGKWCAIGSWAELGPATIANAHLAAATSTFAFASDTHYPLQSEDVLTQPLDMSDGLLAVPRSPGLGVELDRVAMDRLANNQVRESVFYDDIQGEAPRVGQIL